MKTKRIRDGLLCLVMIVSLIGTTGMAQSEVNLDPFENEGIFDIDNAPIIGEYPENLALTTEQLAKEAVALEHYISKRQNTLLSDLEGIDSSVYEKTISLYQVPQETSTWCGYAALKSVLDYYGYSYTQSEIRTEAKKVNFNYTADALPWFVGSGPQYYTTSYFPASSTLNYYLGTSSYQPFGAYNATVNVSTIKPKIEYNIDNDMAVVACGASGPNTAAGHLPGYPNYNVGHWIVVQGYTDYGDTVVIVDPAKSDQVSWSSNISAVYTISTQKFTDYVNAVGASGYSARGIIW